MLCRRDAIDAIRSAQDFGEGEKNPNLITPEKYAELVKKHVMFKDMAADTYLASAGIADDWPYGRGCWQSAPPFRGHPREGGSTGGRTEVTQPPGAASSACPHALS